MIGNKLVSMVNECLNLNPGDRKINFYIFSDESIPDVCLDNPLSILRFRAVSIPNLCLPINQVWHAYYSLQDSKSNEPLRNVIEIPLEVLDKFRRDKDPEILDLFIHYKDKNRLDVYIKSE